MLPVGRPLARSAGVRAAGRGCWRRLGKLAVAFNAAWPGAGHVGRCREHVCGLGWDHQPPVGSRHGRVLLDRFAPTYPSPGRYLWGTCEAPWCPRQGIAAGRWWIGPASHGAAVDRPGPQSGDRCHLLV